MINTIEGLFALMLINLFLGLLLYCVATFYRLITYKSLKPRVLGSCFSIFSPLLLFYILFFKVSSPIILFVAIVSSLGLIYDFFQNYKKCYLYSCSSLLMAHLNGLAVLASFTQSKLALIAYLFFANFCFFFSCFGRLEVFVKTFYISLATTLFILCFVLFESEGIQTIFVGYLCIYCILYLCVITPIIIEIFAYFARIMKIMKKNSVTIKTKDGHIRYVLDGKAHNNIQTPHHQRYTKYTNPKKPSQESIVKTTKNPTSSSKQDLRTVKKYLKGKQ